MLSSLTSWPSATGTQPGLHTNMGLLQAGMVAVQMTDYTNLAASQEALKDVWIPPPYTGIPEQLKIRAILQYVGSRAACHSFC